MCDFYIEEQGKYFQCPNKGKGTIRGFEVCHTHFRFLVRDNKRRNELGLDIPESFEVVLKNVSTERKICTRSISKIPVINKNFINEEVFGSVECEIPEEI